MESLWSLMEAAVLSGSFEGLEDADFCGTTVCFASLASEGDPQSFILLAIAAIPFVFSQSRLNSSMQSSQEKLLLRTASDKASASGTRLGTICLQWHAFKGLIRPSRALYLKAQRVVQSRPLKPYSAW